MFSQALRFQFIAQEKKAYRVTLLCRMMGVIPGGFHGFLRRQQRDPDQAHEERLALVKTLADAADHTDGPRRMSRALRLLGYEVGGTFRVCRRSG